MPAPPKWSDTDNKYLRKVWTDPKVHRDEIVKRIGKTIDTIRMQAKRLGLGGRPRLAPPDEWPPQARARATSMWADGESASAIAKAISSSKRQFSRNAVLGFFHREGIARRDPAESQKTSVPKAKRNQPAAPRKMVFTPTAIFEAPPAPPPRIQAREDAWKPIVGSLPRPWTERPDNGCRWPIIVDGVEGLSCCAKIERGSYCGTHAALSGAPTGSAKELARGLRKFV